MAFSDQHIELLETTSKDIFWTTLEGDIEQMFRQIVNVAPSNKAFEDAMRIQGMPTFSTKLEGMPIAIADFQSGARVRVFHTVYGLGYRITEELVDDDMWNIINQLPEDLAESGRDHQEVLGHAVINDSFAGTNYTGLDGQALISTAHTNLGGTTFSNRLNPDVALSVTGLQTALTQARRQQSDESRQKPQQLDMLLVPPDLMHTAGQLLRSEFDPESNSNARSMVSTSETGLSQMDSPYITSTTQWWLRGRKHSLMYWERKTMDTDTSTDSSTKDFKRDARYRASTAPRDWRGWIGSNP